MPPDTGVIAAIAEAVAQLPRQTHPLRQAAAQHRKQPAVAATADATVVTATAAVVGVVAADTATAVTVATDPKPISKLNFPTRSCT
jgi:hypothetical protein